MLPYSNSSMLTAEMETEDLSDETVLKILRDIQARQAADSRSLEIMQQDIRMLRAALNDFARMIHMDK